jgi:Glycosyl hydrolases family 15
VRAVTDPPIGDHRLLGAGAGAALILPDGTVDWWCGPRVDSSPRLWRLLDGHGPAASYAGVSSTGKVSGAAGPTARTVVRASCGPVELWDALIGDRLVRLARCPTAALVLEHSVDLGGWDGEARRGRCVTTLSAPAGAWAAMAVDEDGTRPVAAHSFASRFDRLERDAADLAGSVRLPGRHRDRIVDAVAVVTACTHAATGAIVAAPTTSLPEAPGHDRQFDYRFSWLRDGSLVASVATLVGRPDIAARHLDFVAGLGDALFASPLVSVDSGPVPFEREVPGVRGWRDSRPVRVGNAATTQVQYDALGFVVAAIADHLGNGGREHRRLWELVRGIADQVVDRPERMTNGIWELRRPDNLVCAEIGRWIALDRALRLGRWLRPWERHADWLAASRRCRDEVLGELRPDGRLPQVYGGDPDQLDASALLTVVFGMLEPDDPRAHRLVDAHLEGLGTGPFLRRYPAGTDDGFSGAEGAFLPCSWWAVSALARLGRLDEAVDRADQLCVILPPLLAEQVDPASGVELGNVPLVWSHMELARGLYLIDRAERRAARGPVVAGADAALRVGRGILRARRPHLQPPG